MCSGGVWLIKAERGSEGGGTQIKPLLYVAADALFVILYSRKPRLSVWRSVRVKYPLRLAVQTSLHQV